MPAYRLQGEWTGLPGTPWLTTFYFDADVAGSIQAARDAMGTWQFLALELCSPGITFSILPEVVTYSAPDTITDFGTVAGSQSSGTAPGADLSRATQLVARLRTGGVLNGRRVLGKSYLPALTTDVLGTDGRPTLASITEYAGTFPGLIAAGLTVASRAGNAFYRVTGADVWNEFGVLRSRRD